MQQLNGSVKPNDVIAKGPHVYDEATRKYIEKAAVVNEYPRAMWKVDGSYCEAQSKDHFEVLEMQGWKTKPPKVQPKTEVAPNVDLTSILLQQQALIEQQGKQIAQLMANQEAPQVIPEGETKHGRKAAAKAE
jgi:hypothetical protein